VAKQAEPVARQAPRQPEPAPQAAAPEAAASDDPAARRRAVLEKMQARLRGGAKGSPYEESDPRHQDARRIARLFVSEIVLYNQERVEQGRKQGDLYALLKNDIDHCREVIRDRIPPDIAAQFDYFYDEIVVQIAQGDESKLGRAMPKPNPPRTKS
jgi:hypothetical protein